MAPKSKTSTGDVSTAKRQKKVMSLGHEVDLLDGLSRGPSVASVSRLYGANESTVCDILKNEKVIRESIAVSTVPSTKVVTHVRWGVHIT